MAGALLQDEDEVRALRSSLDIEVGFHAHNNLSLAVFQLVAIEGGQQKEVGNAQFEVVLTVLN